MELKTQGSDPEDVEVKTRSGDEDVVMLGAYEISLKDFLHAAHYVLTNTNLRGQEDPRLQFVESVRAMRVVKGYSEGIGRDTRPTTRLHTDVPPVRR